MKTTFDLAVIGAGASGFMASYTAAKNGKSVILLDHKGTPATKILISGGGKCNFSNQNVDSSHYFSENRHFCKSALSKFTPADFTDLLKSHAISWEERDNGKLFAFSASEIHDLLFRLAQTAGVQLRFGTKISFLEKKDSDFLITTESEPVHAKTVLISTGGLSYPTTGASDFGYDIAKQFGLRVTQTAPALVPFRFAAASILNLQDLSGISIDSEISVGKKTLKEMLLLTHKGVSGPAGLQASIYWQPGMPLKINFLPGIKAVEWLLSSKSNNEKRKLSTVLAEKIPQRLAARFSEILQESKRNVPVEQLSDKEINTVASLLNGYTFIPDGTDGYHKAEVTKGGIDTNDLFSSTMETRNIRGLFFSGEVMDVTGELGGYNLHWAWASGSAVGRAVSQRD